MFRMRIRWYAIVFLLPLLAPSHAQAQQYDPALYKGMQWRLVGPFRGGRALAVTGIPGDPETFYFGAVGGGVWKTTNGGQNWIPLFDKQDVSSIGAIAVARSDPNVIYVGTGEGCIREMSAAGDGVYKSIDAGKNWTNIGLRDSSHIGAILVNPKDENVVFVAALGHEFGPNKERGVFRSLDGGKTWEKVLYKDENTGAIDLSFDPTNPNIIFALLWQVRRTPWGMTDGGPGSGLYKSIDGGTTWKHLEGRGLPRGIWGKAGVSVGADGNRVYALIEAKDGGLYRSDDSGETWTRVNDSELLVMRPFYYMHVFADPQNVGTVYVLNTRGFRSTNGGKSFDEQLRVPHGDNHDLWIDPTDPRRMIEADDGGATITFDGGKTWSSQDTQPTAQFYHVSTDNDFPFHLYGEQQDNSSIAILSRDDDGAIGRWDWYEVGGGESAFAVADPRDSNIVYATSYDGVVTRFDKRTGQVQSLDSVEDYTDGEGAAKLKYRFQWTTPLALSPQDPDGIYRGAQVLLKSIDKGMSWTPISPDLTRNDKSTEVLAGGPITYEDTGAEIYATIFAIGPSPLKKGLIWVGSDDGLVHITRDDGGNWTDVTPRDIPPFSRVSIIEPSPFAPGAAYLVYDRHMNDDLRPYIFKTTDYGATWTKVVNGIPENTFVHVVREDPKRRGLLYAGTNTGVLVSFDAGEHWQSLKQNLPTASVQDLVVKDDDLAAATFGRAFWILDDLTPLRQISADVASSDVHLYKPAVAYRGPWRNRGGGFIARGAVGQNPPNGVIIDYYLKTATNDEVKLDILDEQGKTIRTFSSSAKTETTEAGEQPSSPPLPAAAGMNRFAWDMCYEPVQKIPHHSTGEYDSGLGGPRVVPGIYRARLSVGKTVEEATFTVKLDPRMHTSQADLDKQLQLALQVHEMLREDYALIREFNALITQLDFVRNDLENANPKFAGVLEAERTLRTQMEPIIRGLINPKIVEAGSQMTFNSGIGLDGKLALLETSIIESDTVPAQGKYERAKDLEERIQPLLAQARELITKDVGAFNEEARKAGIGTIIAPDQP